jgi:hypothetical protein
MILKVDAPDDGLSVLTCCGLDTREQRLQSRYPAF